MSPNAEQILKEALELPSIERASLVDQILSSLDQPDEQIDNLWRKEVEDRIKAYNAGKIKAIDLDDVLSKYRSVATLAGVKCVDSHTELFIKYWMKKFLLLQLPTYIEDQTIGKTEYISKPDK